MGPVLGLVGLLLVDFALIAWALWPSSASTDAASSQPFETSSEPALVVGGGDVPGSLVGVGAHSPAPLVRLVAATSRTTAWLADVGSCDSPGSVHVTRTGGDDWSTQRSPGSVIRVRPTDGSAAFVVGGDADCDARVWYTGDAGAEWSEPQSAENAWGRDPQVPHRILRPGGVPVSPCDGRPVLDLAVLPDGIATALCENGALRSTSDRGASWMDVLARDGLLAVSLTAPGEGALAGKEDGCPGIVVYRLVGRTLADGLCLTDVVASPGHVAISLSGPTVWLVAGNDVLRAEGMDARFNKIAAWPPP